MLPPQGTGGGNLRLYSKGIIQSNGQEQSVIEYLKTGRISGYIDLLSKKNEDTIIIRQYIKKENGEWRQHAEEIYSGSLVLPLVYISPKDIDLGMKMTLQQTTGTYENYDYKFMEES